ncbi:HNH endonuclease signature motif containing protein [Euzebya tangerina]|uniref:HNH endonuclease signature motif containing protein n=1 Tax=Euzebya tangerina TaxID=591198 RepID=UPI000E31DFD4|nr:HNH endonuclease signature motif containing protein [Euzebya tangerina]
MTTLVARRAYDVTSATGQTAAREVRQQLATATGITESQARPRLATSISLQGNEQVAEAVRAGSLSAVQAEVVADAAEAAPDQTADLLAAARVQSVQDLKRTCRDTRAAADPDPAVTRRRHHRDRSFRAWSQSDGEWKAFLSGPADAGARIEAAIRSTHDQIFKTAHAEGRREQDTAYRFDALLATLEGADADAADPTAPAAAASWPGTAGRGGRQTKVIITVDAAALKRGHAERGETCHIAGVGRVPVEAVKEAIPDAHLAYVIRDAVDATVVHVGRQVTAAQRTALQARGYECEVPECRSTHLLEIDHTTDWAISRQTRLDQLAWLCRHHHRDKTRGTHRLTGPPGHRHWIQTNPPDTRDSPPEPAGRSVGAQSTAPAAQPSLLDTKTHHAGSDAADPANTNRQDADRPAVTPVGSDSSTRTSSQGQRSARYRQAAFRNRGLQLGRQHRNQPWIGHWHGQAIHCDGNPSPTADQPSPHRQRLLHQHGWIPHRLDRESPHDQAVTQSPGAAARHR